MLFSVNVKIGVYVESYSVIAKDIYAAMGKATKKAERQAKHENREGLIRPVGAWEMGRTLVK